MYGKFFSSTFTGSMYGVGATVFAVWGYVIANTVNSNVELNPKMLSAVLGATETEVENAIFYLCEPDPKSRNKDRDGRRLVKEGEYQYHVVTHAHYRHMKNEDEKREYNRIKQQESRAKRKKNIVSNKKSNFCQSLSSTVTDTESDTEAKAEAKKEGLTPSSNCVRPEEYANTWNKNRGPLPRVESFGDSRRKRVLARIRDGVTLERFTLAVTCCTSKPFLRGESTSGWVADFDWLIKNSENIEKAITNPYGSQNGNGHKHDPLAGMRFDGVEK